MMAKDQTYGYIGLAYVGVLCASKQYSCSINEKLNSVVASAEVCISMNLFIFKSANNYYLMPSYFSI